MLRSHFKWLEIVFFSPSSCLIPFTLQVLNRKVGLDQTCNFVKVVNLADQVNLLWTACAVLDRCLVSMQGDFMKMPFPDNSFDAVYAIEATCHAPDPVCIFLPCSILTRFFKTPCFACVWAVHDRFIQLFSSNLLLIHRIFVRLDAIKRSIGCWSLVSALLCMSGAWLIHTIQIAKSRKGSRWILKFWSHLSIYWTVSVHLCLFVG